VVTERTNDFPFVSVLVPTWNRAPILERALESLVSQSYPSHRYEVVVADDGSSDGTRTVVSRFEGGNPNVNYVGISHKGPNAARNAGLSVSSGDLICFVDDDVEAPAEWLAQLVAAAAKYPTADCIGGPIWLRLEGRVRGTCGREPLDEPHQDFGPTDRETPYLVGANMAVRRSAVELVGEFDEAMTYWYDEIEWQRRLKARGGKLMYVATAGLWHRRTPSELRLAALLSRRLIRGRNEAKYFAMAGPPVRAGSEFGRVFRGIGHLLRRRCVMGLLHASRSVGRLWGLLMVRRGN